MDFIAYCGTQYEYHTIVKDSKVFGGKVYDLDAIYENYGGREGHKTAIKSAANFRKAGKFARVDAHSGFTAIYVRN